MCHNAFESQNVCLKICVWDSWRCGSAHVGTGGLAVLAPAPSRLFPEITGEDKVEQSADLGVTDPSKEHT